MKKNSLIQTVDEENLQKLVSPLLAWFDNNARILPWRSNPTPYRVWVSEIMLQQTQVKTVVPYFERFVAALPDVEALASAEEDKLLKLWEGLGYYNRARNLQKAARVVMEQFSGKIPAAYEVLLKLPGIGEYTAGAIASIAFNIPEPVVDGNVLRVVSRLLASRADITEPKVRQEMRDVMASLLPLDRPGDFNQAVMELGATVCLPQSPCCSECPVEQGCEAKQKRCANELPIAKQKPSRRIEYRTVLMLMAEGKILLSRRPPGGLLPGLWEPVNLLGRLEQADVRALLTQWRLQPLTLEYLGGARHIFTHIEWKMQGYRVECEAAHPVPPGCHWVDLAELRTGYPLPRAFKNFVRSLP